jgi:biotin carboxyl carrier protein
MSEYHFEINGSPYRVKVKETGAGHAIVEVNGTEYRVEIKTPTSPPAPLASRESSATIAPKIESGESEASAEDGVVRAPMSGVIQKVMRTPSDTVEADEPVLVLEAMKMENEIKAPVAGTIAEIFVVEGDSVNTGDSLFQIKQ